jgi:transcriptional regulator with XRE-family HTH domain
MEQIQYLIDHYQLSASQLADKLDIQRSTISHLLSGRNKPSLDLLKRIVATFPHINEAWLLSGHGNPLKQTIKPIDDNIPKEQGLFTGVKQEATQSYVTPVNTDVKQTELDTDVNNEESIDTSVNNDEIEQILVFYRDGTFKYFRPRK